MVAARLRVKPLDGRLLERTVVAEVTEVVELAPTVAHDILAPASYIQVAPSAVACAGARDHHAIRAVGKLALPQAASSSPSDSEPSLSLAERVA